MYDLHEDADCYGLDAVKAQMPAISEQVCFVTKRSLELIRSLQATSLLFRGNLMT